MKSCEKQSEWRIYRLYKYVLPKKKVKGAATEASASDKLIPTWAFKAKRAKKDKKKDKKKP